MVVVTGVVNMVVVTTAVNMVVVTTAVNMVVVTTAVNMVVVTTAVNILATEDVNKSAPEHTESRGSPRMFQCTTHLCSSEHPPPHAPHPKGISQLNFLTHKDMVLQPVRQCNTKPHNKHCTMPTVLLF
jgi:hypothetical protein